MLRTSLARIVAKLTLRIVMFSLFSILTIHLIAEISLPILQAFDEGLRRINTVQMVAISQDSTADALPGEFAHNQ